MSLWNAVCSVLLCFSVRKNMSFSICHYVILSKKSHLSSFVIMSFCLKKHTCLLLSLCHYVLKIKPFSFCHYVILSKKTHLSPFVIMSLCLKNHTCLSPSLCYSVLKTTPPVTPVLLCYPVSHILSPLLPCVLLSKDVYVCIFYKLSIISLHTQFFLLNLHN